MTTEATSHLMKTTKSGRPFSKDNFDLFCTLTTSLNLGIHRHFFKSYPNSFTADEAAANFTSLKFSATNRTTDPKEPTRILTTTTTTTFSMPREMAKGICQSFMDARLIENAVDLKGRMFKDRGVYMITAKGLHVLERFISKNGITADGIVKLFAEQAICMKLLHLERRSADDEIIITKSVIEVLWRRFVGRGPNVCTLTDEEVTAQINSRFYAKSAVVPGQEIDRSIGILLRKNPLPANERKGVADEYSFSAPSAIAWICDFTSCVSEEEAGEICAHFVRYGFLTFAGDKGRPRDTDLIIVARAGGAGGGAGAIMQEAEFRCTQKAVYRLTKEGMQAARWDIPGLSPRLGANAPAAISKPNLHSENSSSSNVSKSSQPRVSQSTDDHSANSAAATGRKEQLTLDVPDKNAAPEHAAKDSHTARLRQILDEPALRSLFREFLRANFCEENLSYWLDTQDFKSKFRTSSSASVQLPEAAKNRTNGHAAMERHQQELIAMAFIIYNTYLAPASPCELNIDHTLRAEIISYMNQITADKDAGIKGSIEPGIGNILHASQLQVMVRLYERIQTHVYRLMATDSVPKFCKTERFLSLMRSVFDYNEKHWNDEAADHKLVMRSADEGSPTRAYLTISQAANEKAAALDKQRELEKEKEKRAKRA